MKEYQEIRDTSPLGLKMLNDQLRLLWFKTKNTTTKDVRGRIDANKLIVGSGTEFEQGEVYTWEKYQDMTWQEVINS